MRGAVLRGVAAVLLAASGVVLVRESVHGVHSTEALGSGSSVRLARLYDGYYACLSAAAMRLVPKGAPVEIPRHPPGSWITLAKAVDQWARLVRYPSQARVVLELVDRSGPGSCLGRGVVARPGGWQVGAAPPRHPVGDPPGAPVGAAARHRRGTSAGTLGASGNGA
ncbi:MAG: hypothetical protein ACYCUF_02015 [Acidimicrobiales bacterium]|nr:hypothetical protein [Actinomycetota bacterium]